MKLFKKRWYWYQVKYIYRDTPNGRILFDWQEQIGVEHQSMILNNHTVKKITNVLQTNPAVKPHLCNGNLDVEYMCYLGKFSK